MKHRHWQRYWRRLAWGVLAAIITLSIPIAASFWLTTSNAGLRWLTDNASRLSSGQLVIEGVEGQLNAPIDIEKLVFTSATQRVSLQHVHLQWRPRALWQRHLDIELLTIAHVRIEQLKPDLTPAKLPASLRLPFTLKIANWDIARLESINNAQSRVFDALSGQLDGLGDSYHLQAKVTSPWAKLRGQIEIGKDAPFKLQGEINGQRQATPQANAKLELFGQLAAIRFQANAAAESMQFMSSGELTPFAPVRISQLVIAGNGIDPSRVIAGAPRADLAFSGVFTGKLEDDGAKERLLGTFSVNNRLAGRLDQDRLPLANLTGAVLGDDEHADLTHLSIDLGAAGRFDGAGTWRSGQFRLELGSSGLNLAQLQRNLNATKLGIKLVLAGNTSRQNLTAEVSETWGKGHFSLTHADQALRLESANFSGQAGRLSASGEVKLDAGRAFKIQFDAHNINPARFGKFPRARLHANGKIDGALTPTPRLSLQFKLPKGELEGYPVSGEGRLKYADTQLTDTDILLDLAGNRAHFKGAYGRLGDHMSWTIDAPALARLHAKLAGRLRGKGSISGDPAQPQIDAQLDASGLRLPGDIMANQAHLQLNLAAATQGVFTGRLQARGVKRADWQLDTIDANLRGRRHAHQLDITARLPGWQLTTSLSGGLFGLANDEKVWRGQLTTADVDGAWPLRLLAPAALEISRNRQQIDHLSLTLAGGQVNLTHLQHSAKLISTRGDLGNLPLAPLLELFKLFEKPPPLSTDLRVNGDWNLQLGDHFDGKARLRRHSGDLRWHDPAIQLGLSQLELSLNAKADQLSAKLAIETQAAGQLHTQLHAQASAALTRTPTGFSFPSTTPLTWTANFDLPDLRLAKPFIPLGMRADARLSAQLQGSGSLAQPRMAGQINASQIRYSMPEQGISITDGRLKLSLENDRVRVLHGELNGQSGRILIVGEAGLRQPQAGLKLIFEQFAASNRSDRRVIVSGQSQLKLDANKLHLTGELTADRARLEMPEVGRPTLSSDVVIIGQAPDKPKAAWHLPLTMDLKLNLGNDFLFKGAGLDARLGGHLRVFSQNRVLRGEGAIQIVKGRYAAYAQSLDIERGNLRFTGQLDNPGIDVLAVRIMPTVKVGVQVGGSVQRPLVTLYSDPPMPDTEKLSWLVLGQGLDGAGQKEFALLQIAAGTLLSQADSVSFQANLAEALRIDSFSLRAGTGDDLGSSVVSVGKQLSTRTTLSYEQSLDGLSQVVKVLYQLTPHIRLEAQAGQQSSFDAFYSLEFD